MHLTAMLPEAPTHTPVMASSAASKQTAHNMTSSKMNNTSMHLTAMLPEAPTHTPVMASSAASKKSKKSKKWKGSLFRTANGLNGRA